MPLAGAGVVSISFEGDASDLIESSNEVIKAIDKQKEAVKKAGAEIEAAAKKEQAAIEKTAQKYSGSLVPGLQKAQEAVSKFMSANSALIGVTVAVGAAAVKSYQAFQQYAGAVRDVALASGSSAEEASRLLQVLDDYEITAQDVMAATKAMTKQGLEPSIDTLATLADQYVKINDPMKQNEFILKNLGKAGLQWANALSQGGDALRKASDEVNKNLVLTDEQIKKAEMARLAVDSWADAWEGFKVSIGGAIGEMIAANSAISSQAKQYEELTGTTLKFSRSQGEATKNFEAFQAQMARGVAATEFYKAQMSDVTTSTEDLAAQQKALEESSQKYMSVLKNISSETEQYTEKNQDLNNKLAELEMQLSKERKGSKAYKELQGEIDDTKTAITDLAAEHAKASKSIMFDLISQQAAAEGFKNISVEALAALGEQWGVLAEGSGQATSDMINQAEAWSEALSEVPGEIKSIAQMWKDLDKLAKAGVVLTASVVYNATGGAYGGQNTMTQCFTGDTLVSMANGSCIAIRDIRVGDEVLSHDIPSGSNITTKVVEVFEHPASDGGRLLLINNYLKVTPEHLLWNGQTWQPAGEFAPGDVLVNLDGSHMRVTSVREIVKSEPVYNIHVDHEAHNYYAGGVLVHNAKQNDVTTQWQGGTVGSFAGGGKGGGWGIVGDRQGGGWVDGVSELVYGNFKVFPSKQAKGMLKSGMLGKVPGFAFGGNSEDFGGMTGGSAVKIPYVPTPPPISKSGGGGSSPISSAMQAIEYQAADMQASTQNAVVQMAQVTQQMTQQILKDGAQTRDELQRIAAILLHENPNAVGSAVAYKVALKSA